MKNKFDKEYNKNQKVKNIDGDSQDKWKKNEEIYSDVNGSYTGTDFNGAKPEQDSDDL